MVLPTIYWMLAVERKVAGFWRDGSEGFNGGGDEDVEEPGWETEDEDEVEPAEEDEEDGTEPLGPRGWCGVGCICWWENRV